MTLDHVKPGKTVIILDIYGKGLLRRRLLEMGLTPQTKIKVRKVAPMGDPIEIFLRSYVLTLRKEDAAKIEVKEDRKGEKNCSDWKSKLWKNNSF